MNAIHAAPAHSPLIIQPRPGGEELSAKNARSAQTENAHLHVMTRGSIHNCPAHPLRSSAWFSHYFLVHTVRPKEPASDKIPMSPRSGTMLPV